MTNASQLIWRLLTQSTWQLPSSLSEITSDYVDALVPELITDAPSADRNALADAFESLTGGELELMAYDLRDVLQTAVSDSASYDAAWG